jgi:hypothetical protein
VWLLSFTCLHQTTTVAGTASQLEATPQGFGRAGVSETVLAGLQGLDTYSWIAASDPTWLPTTTSPYIVSWILSGISFVLTQSCCLVQEMVSGNVEVIKSWLLNDYFVCFIQVHVRTSCNCFPSECSRLDQRGVKTRLLQQKGGTKSTKIVTCDKLLT